MSTEDRFNQPMDFYTEKEWDSGDDSDAGWEQPTRISIQWEKPSILNADYLRKK